MTSCDREFSISRKFYIYLVTQSFNSYFIYQKFQFLDGVE